MSSFQSRIVWRGGLLVVGIILSFFFAGRDSADVKQDAIDICAEELGDRALAEELVNRHHQECFDMCYTQSGRRRSAKFDADRYAAEMGRRIRQDLESGRYASRLRDNERPSSGARTGPSQYTPPPQAPAAPVKTEFDIAMDQSRGSSEDKHKAIAFFVSDINGNHRSQILGALGTLLTDSDRTVAGGALLALKQRNYEGRSAMVDNVGKATPEIRARIFLELSDKPDSKAIDAFIRHMEDSDPQVQQAATMALDRAGKSAESGLSSAFRQPPTGVSRMKIFAAMVKVATSSSMSTIRSAANDNDEEIRTLARESWKRIDPDTADAVSFAKMDMKRDPQSSLQLLAEAEPDYRRSEVSSELMGMLDQSSQQIDNGPLFAAALSKWADENTKRQLVDRLATTRQESHRDLVAWTVAGWKDPDTVRPMLELIVNEWDAVNGPLKSMGAMIEADALTLARHDDVVIRVKACELIGCACDAAPTRSEMANRARNDKNPQVRLAARWAYNTMLKRSRGDEVDMTDLPTMTIDLEKLAQEAASEPAEPTTPQPRTPTRGQPRFR